MTPENKFQPYIEGLTPIISRCRTDAIAKKERGKVKRYTESLTEGGLIAHLSGGAAIGLCPIKAGESTLKLAVLDLDSHDSQTSWPDMVNTAKMVSRALAAHGLTVIPFRSSGGKGIHLYILWDDAQDAYSVRKLLMEVLNECGFKVGTRGVVNQEIEIFPKQDSVEPGRKGSVFILPMSGQSLPLAPYTLDVLEKEAFLNIAWVSSAPVPYHEKPAIKPATPPDPETLAERINLLKEMLPHICSKDRDKWIKVGMGTHHETGGSEVGFELYHEWSKTASNYKGRDDVRKTWDSFKGKASNPATMGTIRKLAYEGGWSEDVSGEFEVLEDTPDAKKPFRFTLIQAAQFAEQQGIEWHIQDILPKKGLAMVFGESGSGKTFFALDICLTVTRGGAWRDYPIKEPCRVVYVAAEGRYGIINRLKAYAEHYGLELAEIPFYVIDDSLNLHKDDDAPLIRDIQAQGGAGIIVIDTLAQVIPGANENAGEDMGAVIKRCQRLADALQCLVILIHHSGKDASKGSRGWSGMKGAMDTEIQITKRAPDAFSTATVTKQKDGESGEQFSFRLESVCIGENEDGTPITSCVVDHLGGWQAPKPKPKLYGKWQQLLLDAAEMFYLFDGSTPIPKRILLDEVIRASGSDLKDGRDSPVKRALNMLIERGYLTETEDGLTLAQSHKPAQSA